MRILFICVALFAGCLSAGQTYFPQIENTVEKDAVDPRESPTSEELQTPAEISADNLPDYNTYPITTRIVIEGQPITLSKEGKIITMMWWSRSTDDVKQDLSYEPRGQIIV